MFIIGKAVLAFGIFSVFGAAVHNHNQAAPQVANVSSVAARATTPALQETDLIVVASTATGLPRGYWSNPATSPLQGIGMPMKQTSGPIRHLSVTWQGETRFELSSDWFQLALLVQSGESN
jgi:hypothetical protein